MDIEPLDGPALCELADSLAAQAAAYAQRAEVHLVDLCAGICLAAAFLLRANLPAPDALAQWRRLADQVTDLLNEEPEDGQHKH